MYQLCNIFLSVILWCVVVVVVVLMLLLSVLTIFFGSVELIKTWDTVFDTKVYVHKKDF